MRLLTNGQIIELATFGSEEVLCKVCCEDVVNAVFLECGHLVCCLECATKIEKGSRECPICRSRIVRVVHVFKA